MIYGSVSQSFIRTLADLISVLMRPNLLLPLLLLLLCVSKIQISARDKDPSLPAGSPGGAARLAPPTTLKVNRKQSNL